MVSSFNSNLLELKDVDISSFRSNKYDYCNFDKVSFYPSKELF